MKASQHKAEASSPKASAVAPTTSSSDTVSRFEDHRPEAIAQREFKNGINGASNLVQRVENNTGLPDNIKTGVESLSGHSLDDVKVHYNSSKPAQLNAHAYAQGTDIHMAPGQEKHLPHEAWHVVQQKQGRVKPTMQLQGVSVNDDVGLEKEADVTQPRASKNSEETEFQDLRPEAIAQRQLKDKIDYTYSGSDNGDVSQMVLSPSLLSKLKIVSDDPVVRKYGKPIEEMSRAELNLVIDDTQLDESYRVEAEAELKRVNLRVFRRIKALVAKGNYQGALDVAVSIAEVNQKDFKLLPTDDYSKVVPKGTKIPRGTPDGVTVDSDKGPVIYIHIERIKTWAEEDSIGDLLSTIRHEAKHAEQKIEDGPVNQNEDAREFEAYSEEVLTAYNLAQRLEDTVLPTSQHIQRSYEMALSHHKELSIFESLRFIHRLSDMKEKYKKLYPYLIMNDKDSGRVGNMASTVKGMLKAYIESNGKTNQYGQASKMYMRIPEIFRKELDREFDPLFDKASGVSRKMGY